MRRALAQAKVGHGQIVGVMGEPGLGNMLVSKRCGLLWEIHHLENGVIWGLPAVFVMAAGQHPRSSPAVWERFTDGCWRLTS
jgi:hypothetical protein